MSDRKTGNTMPSEWDGRVNTVLMAYPAPHTDWHYMLEAARKCFNDIIRVLVVEADVKLILLGSEKETEDCLRKAGVPTGNITICDIPYNDTWARDFGPLMIEKEYNKISFLDFRFNGWGLKFAADKDNMICRNMAEIQVLSGLINRQGFVLEGGSVESDGEGTVLTTSACLLSPNRNPELTETDIDGYLRDCLCADRILWLNHGYLNGDDTDSHIDTLARFVNDTTIAYVKCYEDNDVHFYELQAMEEEIKKFRTSEGKPYNLIPLPLPDPVYDEEHHRLPATYANFLITPTTVLLPVYGQDKKDSEAIQRITDGFPDKKIIPIDCSALIRQHGSLHCVTMQMILE